jgi:hypothetical protein
MGDLLCRFMLIVASFGPRSVHAARTSGATSPAGGLSGWTLETTGKLSGPSNLDLFRRDVQTFGPKTCGWEGGDFGERPAYIL